MSVISLAGKFRDEAAKKYSGCQKPYWLSRKFNNHERLKRTMDLLSQIPEGKDLLEFAKEREVSIHLIAQMNVRGAYFPASNVPPSIHLNSCMSITNMAITLAHELRHAWQYQRLGLNSYIRQSFSPAMTMMFVRLIEGDAHAFTKQITAKIARLTGAYIAEPEHIASSQGQTWRKNFEDFQRSARASGYDEGALRIAATSTSHDIKSSADFADFNRILVEGSGDKSPAYMEFRDNEELAQSLLSHVNPDVMQRAQNTPICPPLQWW